MAIISLYYIDHNKIQTYGKEALLCDENLLPCYRKRAEATSSGYAALAFLGSALLFRYVLQVSKDEELIFSPLRKPALADQSCFISLSHDDDYSILAVSDSAIGCDIEKIRNPLAKVADRNFPPAYLRELAADPSPAVFTRLWTQTEAILKAEGTGFTCSLQKHPELLDHWVTHSSVFHNYSVTIACEENFDFPSMQEILPIE